jgi:hypothetical protein
VKHEEAMEIISNVLQLAIDSAYSDGHDEGMKDFDIMIHEGLHNG